MKYERKPPQQPPTVAGRVPPHDLDAEAAVLSAVLLKRGVLDEVADLRPEHFFSESNGTIFEAARDLHMQSSPIDLVTVASWLRDRELLRPIGGSGYLAQIVDATPAVAHVREHAAIVMRKARMRRAISAAQLIAAEGYGDLDAESEDAWLDALPSRLEEHENAKLEAVHVGTAMRRIWEERRANNGNQATGPSSGVVELDRRMGGLRGGKVSTVAARSGIGKTALAFQAAASVTTGGDAALVFELEAPEEECVDRLQYATAGVDGSQLLRGIPLSQDDMRALNGAAEAMNRGHLWILARSTITATQIRAEARKLAMKYKRLADGHYEKARRAGLKEGDRDWPEPTTLKLVVVDYIQLVSASDMRGAQGANREAQVSHVSREMKRLAMDLNIHVMMLCQLNKDGDKRGADTRPRTSDMRESSAVENDSDHIIMIYNPHALARSRGERDGEEFDEVELILGKNRGGKPGTIHVQWWPSQQTYQCVARPEW